MVRRARLFRSGECMRPIFLYAVGLSLALGAGGASAADPASNATIVLAPHEDQGPFIYDLGLLPALASSDNPAQAPSSASTVSSAEPVPELPTWSMMLLCLAGLGFAAFRKGRKDRLSPGIE
jgi:hypothetical protein